MMKIAIAGTNGLAQFIAYYLSQITSHSFVFLTRTPNPGLKDRDWQVLVVSYDNQPSLIYTLMGVDLVISTISGEPETALVEAAAKAQVRHFIPSAFSGPQQCQSQVGNEDEWDNLITLLEHHLVASSMHYTIFTCGVFYERFGPGGLNALQISTFNNRHGSIGDEGNFLVDIRAGKTTIPISGTEEELSICMTSARDVARYIVAALQAYEDMEVWPKEFKFCTERLTMSELLDVCSRVRGAPLQHGGFTRLQLLLHNLDTAIQSNNINKAISLSQHIAVAQAHPALDFPLTEINLQPNILAFAQTPGSEPAPSERFETWLLHAWTTPVPPASSARASANTSGKSSGLSSRSASSQKSKRPTPQAVAHRESPTS